MDQPTVAIQLLQLLFLKLEKVNNQLLGGGVNFFEETTYILLTWRRFLILELVADTTHPPIKLSSQIGWSS